MKVIITGATGMIGKGVLLECLDSPEVNEILVITRNSLNMDHPKLKEIIHHDFSDYSDIKERLSGFDACFFCLGISAVGLKEDEYRRITYDFALALARTLVNQNPGMTFTYVSGVGTDSTEKGRVMWAKVKGKTENDLLKLGFRQAYMFRPGMIVPKRGVETRTPLYRFMYRYFMWLVNLIKIFSPKSVVDTVLIGRAMINAVAKGYSKNILTPADILELAGE